MVEPWAQAGFECICIDIQHSKETVTDGAITYIGDDINRWIPPMRRAAIVFAFPPCTDLAVSGARWFTHKGLWALIDSLTLVERCRRICEASSAPWMLENPVSTLSTYWRKPDHTFDPCDFGGYLNPPADAYTKRTCLWVGGGFRMPRPNRVDPVQGSKMHLMAPSDDRANLRSETPRGFAKAVFEANVA